MTSKVQQNQHIRIEPPSTGTLESLPNNVLVSLGRYLIIHSLIALSLVNHRFHRLLSPKILDNNRATCQKRAITRFLSPHVHSKRVESLKGDKCLYCGTKAWCPSRLGPIWNGTTRDKEYCNSPGVFVQITSSTVFFDEDLYGHLHAGYTDEPQKQATDKWYGKIKGKKEDAYRSFYPFTRWCRHHRCEGYNGVGPYKNAHMHNDNTTEVLEGRSLTGRDGEGEEWRVWCNHCSKLMYWAGSEALRGTHGEFCACLKDIKKDLSGCNGEVCGRSLIKVSNLWDYEDGRSVASVVMVAKWSTGEAFELEYEVPDVKTWEIMDVVMKREPGMTEALMRDRHNMLWRRPRIYDFPVSIIKQMTHGFNSQAIALIARADPAFAKLFGWATQADLGACALLAVLSGPLERRDDGRFQARNCTYCNKTHASSTYRGTTTSIGRVVLPATLVNPSHNRGSMRVSASPVCEEHGILHNTSCLEGFGNEPGSWFHPPVKAGVVTWCCHCQSLKSLDIKVPFYQEVAKKAVKPPVWIAQSSTEKKTNTTWSPHYRLEKNGKILFWARPESWSVNFRCTCENTDCGVCRVVGLDLYAGRMRNSSKSDRHIKFNDIWWTEYKGSA